MTVPPTIFHVDMDAFYASVEVRDDPSLRGKPVLVGGVGRRGVVAAASYEARAFGCRSAMPMAVALRHCPQAVVLPGRHEVYAEVSDQVFEIFARFSPVVEPLSIDEAFLDLGGTERLFGPPRVAAEALRKAVRDEVRLTCSVGISAVKFVAKIASGRHKPDGLTEVPPGREVEFLAPLPVEELWGVGPKTAAHLRAHGIVTIGDIAKLERATLDEWFGENGLQLHRLSRAIDPREVVAGHDRKGLSHEDTYAVDVVGEAGVRRKLLSQATRVADRLVAKGIRGRLVRIKIRDIAFTTESRQCMLDEATQDARVIYRAACRLLRGVELSGRRFRLTGVGVGALVPVAPEGPMQLELLVEPGAKPPVLQSVVSAVRRRFGHAALYPAEAGAEERAGSAGGMSDRRDEE
jgi:DNA polymerase-4